MKCIGCFKTSRMQLCAGRASLRHTGFDPTDGKNTSLSTWQCVGSSTGHDFVLRPRSYTVSALKSVAPPPRQCRLENGEMEIERSVMSIRACDLRNEKDHHTAPSHQLKAPQHHSNFTRSNSHLNSTFSINHHVLQHFHRCHHCGLDLFRLRSTHCKPELETRNQCSWLRSGSIQARLRARQ